MATIDLSENAALKIDYDGGDYTLTTLRPDNLPYWSPAGTSLARTEEEAVNQTVEMGVLRPVAVRAVARVVRDNIDCYKDCTSRRTLAAWRRWLKENPIE
jgi:hypothetical protein